MNIFFNNYMEDMIRPMREELTKQGFIELKTPDEVAEAFDHMQGTALVVINSVCGCAAGLARPAAIASLNHDKKPDHIYTVFAGQEKEATAKAREYFVGYPPSSPSFAVMKDGQIMGMVERHEIEDSEMHEIVGKLTALYDEHCK